VRVRDWREVYEAFAPEALTEQASRCMDCGIPFCHEGCPLGNLIPEWNDLVYREQMADAAARLEATNNFPEFTGRLCPAPCEGSCVLGINSEPVLIKQVELEIAEWSAHSGGHTGAGRLEARPPGAPSGKRVAIVGSGPAGLSAAQQLTRAGHHVVVYERAERIGGLLRYGIPQFKMEKEILDRRLDQMRREGTIFRTRTSIGATAGVAPAGGARPEGAQAGSAAAPDAVVMPVAELLAGTDAVVLAGGSTVPRDLDARGRHLDGVHFAMDYLKPSNLVCEGALSESPISAAGRDVVIIGGGDTGADCLGTAHRQGAASVHQLEILAAPPQERRTDNPWPTWPVILRTSSAHEEGGRRLFAVQTTELTGDEEGRVRSLRLSEVRHEPAPAGPGSGGGRFVVVEGSEMELAADLVLLAMGFSGPERSGLLTELGVGFDSRGNVAVDGDFSTGVEGIFACGDMARGQSLIVWAIAEGRSAAAAVDRYLMGKTALSAPIAAGQLALR
jgi:glutamate synthase (NADPH/NADH) small chain